MKPCNRHLFIQPIDLEEEKEEPALILPEDFHTLPSHMVCLVLEKADDCKISAKKDDVIIVDTSMIQHIEINEESFHLILENYVLGVLE